MKFFKKFQPTFSAPEKKVLLRRRRRRRCQAPQAPRHQHMGAEGARLGAAGAHCGAEGANLVLYAAKVVSEHHTKVWKVYPKLQVFMKVWVSRKHDQKKWDKMF